MNGKMDKIKIKKPKPRRTWEINPVTKVKPSGKIYKRVKLPEEELDLSPHPEKNYIYCPRCSAELVEKRVDHKKRKVCPVCRFVFYKNPTPAAGVVIEKEGKLLLGRRKFEPFKGDWSLPAGFMEYNESPQECAKREAKEELNLYVEINEIFGVYSGKDDPRTHAVLIMYWAKIIGGELRAGDDVEEARFFSPEEIPLNIAFQAHRQIIKEFFALRNSARE